MSNSILIFDSGVGGLSIAEEVRRLLPQHSMTYLMDDAVFPYGVREDQLLASRIPGLCREAVARLEPDLLIIACNTASTLALASVREQVSIPVVGVVPAIKTAAEQTRTGHIGLLATPATIARPYTRQLIKDFAPECSVRLLGNRALVDLAEETIQQGRQPSPEVLKRLLNDWLMEPKLPSHVVLGCTHFPLLKPTLATTWPQINWIDSGAAIARRVKHLLQPDPTTLVQSSHRPEIRIYWTQTFTGKEHPSLNGILRYCANWGAITDCSGWNLSADTEN
jgi:glutamate racemase